MDEIMAKVKELASVDEAHANSSWRVPMQAKYDSFVKNDTWELVEWPSKINVIGTKWVWKEKYKADGTVEKFKSSLVT